MNITPQQVQKLLQCNIAFSSFGFSLLITRLKRTYEGNPTEAALLVCVKEINSFLTKHARTMDADFAIISQI